MPSFDNKKQLRFKITLGTGKFGSSDNDTITLQGFRAAVDIDKAGGMMMGTLKARIYGVKQEDMNSITTLQWKPKTWIPNTIEVTAIDGATETLIFAGNIVNAWGDYQGMPDVHLQIQAQSAFFGALNSIPPKSYKGAIDVAVAMKQIADDLGLTFENNGVSAQLVDMYLPNTALEQAKELAKAAGCWLYIDDKILAITPENAPRKGIIPEISKDSGLVGYPTFDGVGVNFRAMFNPGVIFGGLVKLTTDVTHAAGEWIVTSVAYHLESEKPNGQWFAHIRGNANGLAVTK